MIDHRAVARYARALFGLAEKRGELEALDRDFTNVRRLVDGHAEITHLVSNSTIAFAEKEDFLEKIVPAEISHLLLHFLKVLVKKKRFRELTAIQDAFHRLFEKKQGIQEVRVVSAAELSNAQEKKLQEVLKKKLNAQIRLVPTVDPNLIGGLILRFDGTEINASIRNRLEELRQKLMA